MTKEMFSSKSTYFLAVSFTIGCALIAWPAGKSLAINENQEINFSVEGATPPTPFPSVENQGSKKEISPEIPSPLEQPVVMAQKREQEHEGGFGEFRESAPLIPHKNAFSQESIVMSYRIIGRVMVKDSSSKGFSREEAGKALQTEAFRHFGIRAKGITNLKYEKKTGLPSSSERFSEASGDVVTWDEGLSSTSQQEVETSLSVPEAERGSNEAESSIAISPSLGEPFDGEKGDLHGSLLNEEVSAASTETQSPVDILVLSGNDLLTINFQMLGGIAVRDNSKEGFTEERAINALKIEAFKRYGSQVRGIANVDHKREMTILRGSKISEAYADAVTWKAGEKVYREARMTPTSFPYYPDGVQGATGTQYSTRTVRAGQIVIITEDTSAGRYKELGPITVTAPERYGFKKSEANRALRKKAFQEFKGEAWGIINAEYERASCLNCEGRFLSAKGIVVSR